MWFFSVGVYLPDGRSAGGEFPNPMQADKTYLIQMIIIGTKARSKQRRHAYPGSKARKNA
jgi:hypothetical protein